MADRWHLWHNLVEAVEKLVRQPLMVSPVWYSMTTAKQVGRVRTAIGAVS